MFIFYGRWFVWSIKYHLLDKLLINLLVSNLALVGYNKRILYAAVGAPRKHLWCKDAKKYTIIPKDTWERGNTKIKYLFRRCWNSFNGSCWGFCISSTFMAIEVLQRGYLGPQQKYFNKKLCFARVVTENAYGMLKGRWRILYKQTECRMYNLKYVIMSCIMLHNLCISVNDTCEPWWCLDVKEFGLIKKDFIRTEKKGEADLNRLKNF